MNPRKLLQANEIAPQGWKNWDSAACIAGVLPPLHLPLCHARFWGCSSVGHCVSFVAFFLTWHGINMNLAAVIFKAKFIFFTFVL